MHTWNSIPFDSYSLSFELKKKEGEKNPHLVGRWRHKNWKFIFFDIKRENRWLWDTTINARDAGKWVFPQVIFVFLFFDIFQILFESEGRPSCIHTLLRVGWGLLDSQWLHVRKKSGKFIHGLFFLLALEFFWVVDLGRGWVNSVCTGLKFAIR